jgi:hypothetical protein
LKEKCIGKEFGLGNLEKSMKGTFLMIKRQGKEFYWPSGQKYEGDFVNGKRKGK